MSFLKCSIDGLNGSGKTGTTVRLAVGIAKEYGDGAPVVGYDAEDRMRLPATRRVFEVEGVPLIRVVGKSLVTLQEAFSRARSEGASVFIADQLTTPWKEGLKSFAFDDGRLPFDRRQQLMNQWEPVVDSFRYGKFHAICLGRLGWQWENVEDENGNLELVQGDSKFNAGGGENFGYEAELELEVRRRKRRFGAAAILDSIRGKTTVEHVVDVIKDAGTEILNGKQFIFPTSQGPYQKGDYRPVLEAFRPYLEAIRECPPPTHDGATTRDLLISGKTAWAKDQTNRKSLLEDISGLFDYCFGSAQSKDGKMFRNLTLEYWGYGWSWSRMEDGAPTVELERNRETMLAVRRRIEQKEIPTDHASMLMLLNLCTAEILYPERPRIDLWAAMGAESVKSVTTKKAKPQAVVHVMDHIDEDEVAGA